MCIDEMIVFLYFCAVLWSNVHRFGGMPASFFRVAGLINVNVEVMWMEEMCW